MSLVGKKIGNYNITQQLGEGGMGAVYLGEHPLIGKKVAVKVLHDELAQKQDIVSRFFTEAKAVNDIHHENIVDISDFGEVPDDQGRKLVYFVMELLEGESLAARLERGRVSFQETVHIIEQAASALAASHANGIVHRDIKPDNIYLIHRGHDDCFVKLLDFGIAKLTGDSPAGASSKTRTGSVIGTPAYMSPEQCDGKGNIDYRSDIYSLGVVMFELLAARVPFDGEGFGEILVAHLTKMPPKPSDFAPEVPPSLEAIVMRCLEKSRDMRFQSMDELRTAIEGADLAGAAPRRAAASSGRGGTQVRPTTLSESVGEVSGEEEAPIRRSRAPIFAATGLAAAVALAAVGLAMTKKKPGPAPSKPTPAATVAIVEKAVAPEMVSITIDSTPPGAAIRRAGRPEPVGKTPHQFQVTRGSPSFDVMLALDGWKSETRTIPTEASREILVPLSRQAESPPPAAARPVTRVRHVAPKRPASAPAPLPKAPEPRFDEDGVMKPNL